MKSGKQINHLEHMSLDIHLGFFQNFSSTKYVKKILPKFVALKSIVTYYLGTNFFGRDVLIAILM